VLAFFAQHDIVDRISEEPKAVNLLLRSNGKPSGQAIVQMRGREDAELARHVLSGQWMGSRYIEVFLCGQDGNEFSADSELAAVPPAATAMAGGNAQPIPVSLDQAAAIELPSMAHAAGESMPFGGAASPPPWMLAGSPWAMHNGMNNGVATDTTETSWEALFEFLGSGGTPATAAVASSAPTPAALNGESLGAGSATASLSAAASI